MPDQSAERVGRMRVVKKLDPSSRGAIKLSNRFGKTLVCVRHRVDASAQTRFTTVELLVDEAPIKTRPGQMVEVKISWQEQSLRDAVKAAGAKWDPAARVWRMPRRLAGILRLQDRLADG
jgi:hypothetical protein